jgi:hypothetical protein
MFDQIRIMHRSITTLLFFVSLSLSGQVPQPSKEEQLAIAKKYPGLRVQASVGTRTKPVPGSSYMKTMTISPAVVIESAQTQPMAAASITCLLITMNTRDKYVRSEQTCRIATSETIGVPAVLKGTRRKFEFAPLQTRFDSDRDKSNVGGEVYKYFLLAVLSEDQKFLYLETSCPGLDKYLQTHPEERAKYLGLKPGSSFSSNFQK